MTYIDTPTMSLRTAFEADAVTDADGVAIRQCPACHHGVSTFAEDGPVTYITCSAGCTPEQITNALYRSLWSKNP
jgi:hypothetical protein